MRHPITPTHPPLRRAALCWTTVAGRAPTRHHHTGPRALPSTPRVRCPQHGHCCCYHTRAHCLRANDGSPAHTTCYRVLLAVLPWFYLQNIWFLAQAAPPPPHPPPPHPHPTLPPPPHPSDAIHCCLSPFHSGLGLRTLWVLLWPSFLGLSPLFLVPGFAAVTIEHPLASLCSSHSLPTGLHCRMFTPSGYLPQFLGTRFARGKCLYTFAPSHHTTSAQCLQLAPTTPNCTRTRAGRPGSPLTTPRAVPSGHRAVPVPFSRISTRRAHATN